MRRSLVTLTAVAIALAGAATFAMPTDADAQTRRAARAPRTVVVITPRYLTAGTQVSPSEMRASVPAVDARFRSVAYEVGTTNDRYFVHPLYLPFPHTTIEFDSPLGRRLPGER